MSRSPSLSSKLAAGGFPLLPFRALRHAACRFSQEQMKSKRSVVAMRVSLLR